MNIFSHRSSIDNAKVVSNQIFHRQMNPPMTVSGRRYDFGAIKEVFGGQKKKFPPGNCRILWGSGSRNVSLSLSRLSKAQSKPHGEYGREKSERATRKLMTRIITKCGESLKNERPRTEIFRRGTVVQPIY